MRMRLIADELKILELILKDGWWPPRNLKSGHRKRRTTELFVGLLQVIQI
jgi:hypothetical protein